MTPETVDDDLADAVTRGRFVIDETAPPLDGDDYTLEGVVPPPPEPEPDPG